MRLSMNLDCVLKYNSLVVKLALHVNNLIYWFAEIFLLATMLQVVSACREVSGSISVFTDMLVQCCFCNEKFSFSVIYQVMVS